MRQFLFSRSGLVMLGFLAVGGYFLWQEHSAHLLGYLPLIFIVGGCLVMHLLMHGRHGGHGGHGGGTDDGSTDSDSRRAP